MVILISATAAKIQSDAETIIGTDESIKLVLDATASPTGAYRLFFASLGDPIWSRAGIVHFGRSMCDMLHSTALFAIIAVARRVAPQSELVLRGVEDGLPIEGGPGEPLADWILAEHARTTADVPGSLTGDELRYLVASGARRARSFARCLPNSSYRRLADIGAGVGFIAWLLASRELQGLAAADLFEPAVRYVRAGRDLWARQPGVRFRFEHGRAEAARIEGPYDAIMMGQMILLTAQEERLELFRRIADALAPGGRLLINEAIRTERPADPTDKLWSKRLRLLDLLGLLSIAGEPRVYHRVNNWSAPLDPSSIPSDDYASDSIFVVEKRQADAGSRS